MEANYLYSCKYSLCSMSTNKCTNIHNRLDVTQCLQLRYPTGGGSLRWKHRDIRSYWYTLWHQLSHGKHWRWWAHRHVSSINWSRICHTPVGSKWHLAQRIAVHLISIMEKSTISIAFWLFTNTNRTIQNIFEVLHDGSMHNTLKSAHIWHGN